MTDDIRSPAEIRAMFGSNLRRLARQYPTVSELCRQLGINRTQFNRYLSGESVPRPDVLDRICRFFDVDARILLKPLDGIPSSNRHPAASTLTEFLGLGSDSLSKTTLLSGFYAATEYTPSCHRTTLLYARQLPQCTLIRGYESRAIMPGATSKAREIQGIAACTGEHAYILMSRRDGENSHIYLIAREAMEGIDQWRGTVVSPSALPPATDGPRQVTWRHLGQDTAAVLDTARKALKGVMQDASHARPAQVMA
ncbi:helix-turn-helix transcriptional regulator [Rhodobacteraceae bacterium B1Z28]|uniref:Helix-turn-helix transcriptional regulator n=1 Tax=Ruegeria haliotis TaxID=2747601 RepID=A0ABX2PN79_9RHOB|nr:helix-turn-helix transcriptional regulator [Ruegeria haliotis]NVO55572.1 helix-turn-helix transcriptional regulator [Ruegeria haliotis]